MDAIALHQAGFTNTVAVMGVGISERNIRFLKSLTPNIILALDSDKAGFSAMERLNAGFMSHDVLPRYLDFSPHKDPDDFIRTEGKAAFEQKLSDAIPFIDVQLDRLIPAQPPSALDRKLRVLDQIFQALSPLRGHLLATERLIQSAKKLGLQSDPTQIIKNYNDFLNSQRPPSTQWAAKEEESQPVIPVLEPKSEPAQTEEKPVHKPLTKAERTLIQGFVQHPSCLKEVTELLDFIDSDDIKSFVFTLRDLYFEADESEYENLVRALLVRTGPWPELIEVVTPALFKYVPESLDENAHAKLVRDFRRRLKKERIEERRMELRKRHKDCANEEEARQLMTELQLLEKELMEVKLSQK
jgi:DNA primase